METQSQQTGNSDENGRSSGGDDSDFGGIRLIPDLAGEPRVYDLDLGTRLGFDRIWKIRELIERNLGELADYAEVVRASPQLEQAFRYAGRVSPHGGDNSENASTELKRSRGRPGRAYLLNKDQAILVAILSRTPTAAMVRRQVITAYKAYRAGLAQPRPEPRQDLPPRPDDAKVIDLLASTVRVLERQGRIIERQQVQMDALARRLGRAEARATTLENRVAAMEMAPAVPIHQTSPMAFRPNDLLGRFLAGCTDPEPLGQTGARALYLAWCEWCRAAGLLPGTETRFGLAMKAHGADFRKSGHMFYLGFTLRERAAWAPASVVQRDGGAA